MKDITHFIIDFDSTFIKLEALDELAGISLKRDKAKLDKVTLLTAKAMNGEMSFSESLTARLKLMKAESSHLPLLIKKLKKNISRSVISNRSFFKKYSKNIYIISGGFKEYIIPITSLFNIPQKNVFANEFTVNKKKYITGFKNGILSKDKGKIEQLKKLKLKGEIVVIGDGYTDYELKEAGIVTKFYAFTENILRDNVAGKADHVAPSFDEFLFDSKLPMSISYPKNRIKILLLENIHNDAYQILKDDGFAVQRIDKALTQKELSEVIRDVSILGIRSKTQINAELVKHAKKLIAVGAFCIGTNQVDLDECSRRGIAVFNAPFSNTRSVVELVMGEIIMLMRNIFDKSSAMHSGIWNKTSDGSRELRGKSLGIIGYGKIGSQLSVLAEAFGMDVYYYDIVEKLAHGNAEKCSTLKELLKKSDVISVHIDGNKLNENLIGSKEFNLMKQDAIFLNLSRGKVVNLSALKENIEKGKLKGAAIDVFPEEPFGNSNDFKTELSGLKNVILTPHIGGSTLEAQKNIAHFVSNKLIDFVNSGNSFYSVNFPDIQLPAYTNAHRLIHIHENVPGILANINSIFASHKINIIGQYLKTNELIGYVITDISKKYEPELINELKRVRHTIKFRILY